MPGCASRVPSGLNNCVGTSLLDSYKQKQHATFLPIFYLYPTLQELLRDDSFFMCQLTDVWS